MVSNPVNYPTTKLVPCIVPEPHTAAPPQERRTPFRAGLNTNHCTAFYVGITTNKLAERMNGDRQTVWLGDTQYPAAEHDQQQDSRDLHTCYTTHACGYYHLTSAP